MLKLKSYKLQNGIPWVLCQSHSIEIASNELSLKVELWCLKADPMVIWFNLGLIWCKTG